MVISARKLMTSIVATALLVSLGTSAFAEKLSDDQLGGLISAQGLKATQIEQRFDFGFKAKMDDDEWELSMSAVLSQDGESVWLMAWLDELPKSAADVPRTALLRLLAANDKMGNGKFFAYIANNRRFVLQRVVATEGLDTAKFRVILQDLGATVVETYPQWSVANWNNSPESAGDQQSDISAASGQSAGNAASKTDYAAGVQR